MNRFIFAIILGWNLIAGLEIAGAQTEETPTPKPPFLASVPDYGHWVVTFKYKAEAPPVPTATSTPSASTGPTPAPASPVTDDGSPISIDTIKTGDLRGVVLTFANGTSKQYTCQGEWILCSTGKGAQLIVARPTALPYMFYATGFVLVDGTKIDPSTFLKAEKYNGMLTFHYKSGDTDVWIDPNSMLPVAAKQGGVEVTYQFLNPPPRPFPIPKDQADLLQQEQQAYKSTRSMR